MKTVRFAGMLMVGMILFAGLPLVGWGASAANEFFVHPARMGYMVCMTLLMIFSAAFSTGFSAVRKRSGEIEAGGRSDLLVIQIISLVIVLSAPYTDRRQLFMLTEGEWIRYTGLVLLTAGFILMHAAQKYLGRQFSVRVSLQENHKLVTSGPYAKCRHPRYTGILMFFLGVAFVYKSFFALVMVCVLFSLFLWRIGAEEALLQKEFGEEWNAYCEVSWRLIPYVL